MPGDGTLTAVIWDFDGTIADSMARNLSVARAILKDFGRDPDLYPLLGDKQLYAEQILSRVHWTDFYTIDLGLSVEETEHLGKLWGPYQKRSRVPHTLYPGIEQVIKSIEEPQGIFSINSGPNIRRFLSDNNLTSYFDCIVGYEQVTGKEKPDPTGLLICAQELTGLSAGTILYLGDHQSDILCGQRANEIFRQKEAELGTPYPVVEMVKVNYLHDNGLPEGLDPNHVVSDPVEILGILDRIRNNGAGHLA